jgi:selenocysteine lyase/cysteine desulfurase
MQCGQALNLQAGDEVLISAQLPDALRRFWNQQARQRGLVPSVTLPVPLNNGAEAIAAFENAMAERSRVLVCSHIQRERCGTAGSGAMSAGESTQQSR